MLKSKTISFRAPELKDLDLLYKWENDMSMWKLSSTVTPFSKHILEKYISHAHEDIYTAKQLRLMIDIAGKDETIGCIDLFDFDPVNMHAGVGILIKDKYRKKGNASEALSMLIDYAFSVLRLHQLYCNITVGNKASLKLFKKHKFQAVGLKKEWIRDKKNWLDEFMLQLINPMSN
jgi:diamine N-acetyltransferase